ncbi:hypothetical protein [Ruegeria arenilitoris]|uniref:hypothetical protein n=1 Tax=Ruegeria arenilitoris TaxID=1173585 RepID=UPI0020C49F53|nr:hypothetical protein [Ruegeria arenilitoris]
MKDDAKSRKAKLVQYLRATILPPRVHPDADRAESIAGELAIDHWNLSRDQIELFVTPTGLDLPLGSTARKTPA